MTREEAHRLRAAAQTVGSLLRRTKLKPVLSAKERAALAVLVALAVQRLETEQQRME